MSRTDRSGSEVWTQQQNQGLGAVTVGVGAQGQDPWIPGSSPSLRRAADGCLHDGVLGDAPTLLDASIHMGSSSTKPMSSSPHSNSCLASTSSPIPTLPLEPKMGPAVFGYKSIFRSFLPQALLWWEPGSQLLSNVSQPGSFLYQSGARR
ncbi:hypothetical protein M011DRAFT_185935 [Sporormia fimetaria CBS 119925]|uniref:Uncharacterized protein n=1 Tax=Sporormia fimetaria CBS 119925 TaxID=1340428 RepID=A0A6A6VJR4_9PLEO|nr:hypothetical protein M011DRAFT_185935 [Sporormia fimetaria CBS 119925]